MWAEDPGSRLTQGMGTHGKWLYQGSGQKVGKGFVGAFECHWVTARGGQEDSLWQAPAWSHWCTRLPVPPGECAQRGCGNAEASGKEEF